MVPRGLLPAMEIDGKVMTESLDIMYLGAKMLARGGRSKTFLTTCKSAKRCKYLVQPGCVYHPHFGW